MESQITLCVGPSTDKEIEAEFAGFIQELSGAPPVRKALPPLAGPMHCIQIIMDAVQWRDVVTQLVTLATVATLTTLLAVSKKAWKSGASVTLGFRSDLSKPRNATVELTQSNADQLERIIDTFAKKGPEIETGLADAEEKLRAGKVVPMSYNSDMSVRMFITEDGELELRAKSQPSRTCARLMHPITNRDRAPQVAHDELRLYLSRIGKEMVGRYSVNDTSVPPRPEGAIQRFEDKQCAIDFAETVWHQYFREHQVVISDDVDSVTVYEFHAQRTI